MKAHTSHGNVTKTAIGYVRVSSQEQATEGVSLDAQRDRLRSYCRLNGIRLIDILSDEGISGSTLERPGLQAARMADAHAQGIRFIDIAGQLNAEGIRARRGGDWCSRMVSVVLQRGEPAPDLHAAGDG